MTAAPRKPGSISLDGDQTTRTRRAAVLEWSDDDENPVAPPPNMQTPPLSTRMEEQSRESIEVPGQQATEIPTGQATGIPELQPPIDPERQADEAPEQQAERRPTVEETRPPPQSTGVDPIDAPEGSGRHRQFKKLHRQTKR